MVRGKNYFFFSDAYRRKTEEKKSFVAHPLYAAVVCRVQALETLQQASVAVYRGIAGQVDSKIDDWVPTDQSPKLAVTRVQTHQKQKSPDRTELHSDGSC